MHWHRLLIPLLLIASGIYAFAGIWAFSLAQSVPAGSALFATVLFSFLVLAPYVVLLHANSLAGTRAPRTTVTIAALIACAIGGFLYYGSFVPNDGEYVLVFWFVPAVQLVFAIPAWFFAWKTRSKHARQL